MLGHKFLIVENYAIIYFVAEKWGARKNWGFGWNLGEDNRPQSWRVTWAHFGIFILWLRVNNMCTKKIPNASGQVMHNYHLVLSKKNPTQIGHHVWKALAPKFRQLMGPPPKKRNSKLCNKNFYMLGAWGFYMLFWVHMVVDTILHQ